MRDFYEHQARARALTRRLALLWTLSVLSLTAITTMLLAGALRAFNRMDQDASYVPTLVDLVQLDPSSLRIQDFLLVGGFVLAGVSLVAFIQWLQLRAGGAKVAKMMGGRQVQPGTMNFAENRALSVIKEMALASNMPMPAVYVIEDEVINAFAAGNTQDDAVIGLTRGAIEQLDRAELQGVIAHEFSHIANGDMRLNIRIVVAIAGLTFIYFLGRILWSMAHGNKRAAGPLLIVGASLVVLGLAGTFFGHIIQAAISRQREYLADASAVQYTRNPLGIAKALQKIEQAGSRISCPEASQFSHMMFAQGARARLFATHPPLKERIRRLGPPEQ